MADSPRQKSSSRHAVKAATLSSAEHADVSVVCDAMNMCPIIEPCGGFSERRLAPVLHEMDAKSLSIIYCPPGR